MLAEALIEFEENAYCPGCGQLKSKAWDPASEGSWDLAHVQCYACQHKETVPQNNDDRTPGQVQFMTLDEKAMRVVKARAKAREQAAE